MLAQASPSSLPGESRGPWARGKGRLLEAAVVKASEQPWKEQQGSSCLSGHSGQQTGCRSAGSFSCLHTVSREGSLPSRDQLGPQRWGCLSSVDWEGMTFQKEKLRGAEVGEG